MRQASTAMMSLCRLFIISRGSTTVLSLKFIFLMAEVEIYVYIVTEIRKLKVECWHLITCRSRANLIFCCLGVPAEQRFSSHPLNSLYRMSYAPGTRLIIVSRLVVALILLSV